jgi:predicted amidohydrolase YtcJ
MSHKHHHGLSCSCCSPLWKYLIPTPALEVLPKLSSQDNEHNETVIYVASNEAKIQTMAGGECHYVEAIGIRNGKVAAVGSSDEVRDALPECQTVRYLQDQQTLLPGFLEPHVHILVAAWGQTVTDVSPFEGQYLRQYYNRAGVFDIIKSALPTEAGKWVVASGMDPSLFDTNGEREIDASILDDISIEIPIFVLNASMHTAYVNTIALKKAYPQGVPDNIASGILQEVAEIKPFITNAFPPLSHDAMKNLNTAVDAVFDLASQRGVTYMHDAAIDAKPQETVDESQNVQYLRYKANQPKAKVRIGGALIVEKQGDLNHVISGYKPNSGDEKFNLSFIKLISDGSNQGLTGAQYNPYCCDDNYQLDNTETNEGSLNYDTTDEFNQLVLKANDHGWPLMIHANGDKAIDVTINAYQQTSIDIERRDRIEHASLLSDEQLDAMIKNGLSPSFLIGHVGYWGEVFKKTVFGETRADKLDRCQSALNKGMRISLHSDNSVTPLGPLRMMEQAITRVMESAPKSSHNVLNEAEQISRFEALKAMTYDAAWQCHMDKWIGSLEVGKCADFVILAQNPLTYGIEDGALGAQGMRKLTVLETYKGGRKTY